MPVLYMTTLASRLWDCAEARVAQLARRERSPCPQHVVPSRYLAAVFGDAAKADGLDAADDEQKLPNNAATRHMLLWRVGKAVRLLGSETFRRSVAPAAAWRWDGERGDWAVRVFDALAFWEAWAAAAFSQQK